MSQFIESLYRLFETNRIDEKKVYDLLLNQKITKQEYEYIVSAKNAK